MAEGTLEVSLFDQVTSYIEKEKFIEAGLYVECNFAALTAIKSELEDVIIKYQLKPVVFSGIQALSNFTREEKRYRTLLESAKKGYILGIPDAEIGMIPGLATVPLDEGKYSKDVFLIINGADYWAALIAKEIRKDEFEAEKNLYKAFITFERKIISKAISTLNNLLIEKRVEIPPAFATMDSFLADVNEKKMKTVIFNSIMKHISELGDQLYHFSAMDSQVGLFNKRYFYLQLIKEVNRFDRKKTPFSLVFFNLKLDPAKLNEVGLSPDDAYVAMGEVIKAGIRKSDDSGFKLKEGEFAVILAETSEQIAAKVAVRIDDAFKARNIPAVAVRIVVTEFNTGKTIKSILDYAERRLKEM